MDKKTKVVEFEKEKDTKNTAKFAEVQSRGEGPIIGSLYVQKWGSSPNRVGEFA